MNGSGRSRRAGALLALAVFFGLSGLLAAAVARTARGAFAASYRPAATVPRPLLEEIRVDEALAIRDFDGDSGQLYLLDPLAPAVRLLRRSGSDWVAGGPDTLLPASFGRRGGGPGEFASPTGLARLADGRIAVAEPGRIHFFTAAGIYLESSAPVLPCALPLPRIAAARRGLFIHGSCLRGGGRPDTMAMVLFWTADGSAVREVARDPDFTTDGSFGTAYGARAGLSEGTGYQLFGAGSSGCVFEVTQTDAAAPTARRLCEPVLRLFRLELSAATRTSLEAARRRSPLAAGALRIPETHPPYVERVALPSGAAWLRGYSEDSLVLRAVGGNRDLAVLPYHGLLGCRRAGCLWADNSVVDGVRLRFLPMSALDSLARTAGPARLRDAQ